MILCLKMLKKRIPNLIPKFIINFYSCILSIHHIFYPIKKIIKLLNLTNQLIVYYYIFLNPKTNLFFHRPI